MKSICKFIATLVCVCILVSLMPWTKSMNLEMPGRLKVETK